MLSSGNEARAALQEYFARPITDLQWELMVNQGYEEAIASGQRTAEDVAAELHALMESVQAERASAEPSGPSPSQAEPLTWEGMEKSVLGRALVSGWSGGEHRGGSGGRSDYKSGGGSDGGPPAPGEFDMDMDTGMDIPDEEPRGRWWLWVLGLLAVAVIAAFVLLFLFDSGPDSTSSSSSTASTSPAVTTTTAPPVTTTSSTTSTTILTTTTLDLTPTYVAHITGDQAVPAVITDATGTLTMTVAEGGESVDYVLEVTGLSDLTIARLRVGVPGSSGDEIFTVYPGPTVPGAVDGVVAQGSFTAAQLLGPLAGKTIADLVALIEDGSVYLNVGTVTNRGGEIRGQLK